MIRRPASSPRPAEQAHLPAEVGPRRRATLALVSTLATLAVLLLTAAPAFAREFHTFPTSFGEAGAGNGQLALTDQSYVAVNQETGDIYVTDTGNARVEEFEPNGTFLRAFGTFTDPTFIAVDNSCAEQEPPLTGAACKTFDPSNGDVYVADSSSSTVFKYEADGTPVTDWGAHGQLNGAEAEGGPFIQFAGIATDASGNLFVYDNETNHWFEFTQEGAAEPTVRVGRGISPVGIAVDRAGNFYKVLGYGVLDKYEPSGSEIGEVDEAGNDAAFTLDPSNNDIYVNAGGGSIVHYPSSCEPSLGRCTPSDTFGSTESQGGELESAAGLAVGPAHTVYVADVAKQRIDEFISVSGVALTVTETGSGSGTVTSKPAGIECGSTCTEEFAKGLTVTLTASRAIHSKFIGWSGCKSESGNECTVTMSAIKTVEAEFAPIPQANLQVEVTGEGEITSSPEGITCTSASSPCTEHFDTEGSESAVTLTATPANERTAFAGWSGPGAGSCTSEPTCEVTMSSAKEVKAEFTAVTQEKLTVADTGSGLSGGRVTGTSPGGEFTPLECGSGATTCEAEYNHGAKITLTATPTNERTAFARWEPGDCESESGPGNDECEVTMSSAKEVKAEFTAIPQETLTVAKPGAGLGGGTVTTSPPPEFTPLDCGNGATTCKVEYDRGSEITLIATPTERSTFARWKPGDCESESGNECKVTMSSAKEVKAEFTAIA